MFIVFSNPVHGSEASGEKAEFNYSPSFKEYFVKHARFFLRGLFLEGLIFGGTYLRRKICVSKSIGLAL